MKAWRSEEGAPFPLGVSWVAEDKTWNFAIYSKHATEVELLFFQLEPLAQPLCRFSFDPLRNKSGPIWHCRIPQDFVGAAGGYAYQVSGPDPEAGFRRHCFDPEKLLLDPYASSVYFPSSFDREAAMVPGSNMGHAPLGVLQDVRCDCDFDWQRDSPVRHESGLVIYEMHVRGFTRDPTSGVAECRRGTFGGVIEKIAYLRELGVTAVELMPVFQFDPGEQNYWGYMPLNFFSPHHLYSSDPTACRQHDEFREMVRELHAAGIEVILDVVYNHTGEGNSLGPTYSFKGIDNTSYYMLKDDPVEPYGNFSGTGNTLHTRNRAVRQLIIDSLHHWSAEGHVDGFRFDLASIFARNPDGSVSPEDPPLFGEITSNPQLVDIRLIAEPWDADGLFQLGKRFPGTLWMQWNAAYRNTLQRFVRGDGGQVADLMTRLYGSADLFPDDPHHAYHPFQSVNYITCHDGFTLYDLTAYNHKNNWANGEDNQDGTDDLSWNCGWEGDVDLPPKIRQLRARQVKNFFCLLMLSNGTPMFRMGDEFLNTQHGNNNPHNQDNEISWLDWSELDANRDVFRFFKQMIAFRKAHPSISRSRFWRDDVAWYGAKHTVDLSASSQQLAWCLHGASQDDDDLYVMVNAAVQDVEFGIHVGAAGDWIRVVDTSRPSPHDFVETLSDREKVTTYSYHVSARSVVMLQRSRKNSL